MVADALEPWPAGEPGVLAVCLWSVVNHLDGEDLVGFFRRFRESGCGRLVTLHRTAPGTAVDPDVKGFTVPWTLEDVEAAAWEGAGSLPDRVCAFFEGGLVSEDGPADYLWAEWV